MAIEKVYYLPIIIVCLLVLTVAVTFFVALKLRHLFYLPPFISDTGAKPPESCIFGQMLNLISLLVAILIYVKYRQVNEIITIYEFTNLQKLNKIASGTGYAAAIGMTIVANFQETNALIVHFIGAMLTFGFGATYQCLQSIIAYKIRSVFGNTAILTIKIILSLISIITFLIFCICSFIFLKNFDGPDMTKWMSSDGQTMTHFSSIVAEWHCAISMALFILILAYDFANIVIDAPTIVLKDHYVTRIYLRN